MRLDRRTFGLDLRLAEFLVVAPILCVAAYAAWYGLETAIHLGRGLGLFIELVVVGAWVMALHYVVATLPSIVAWGLTFGAARALGLSDAAALRLAAPITALVAALLLLTWLRDEDCRAMVTTIAVVSVAMSGLVAPRLRPLPA